jgi:hypothetical protein
VVRPQGLTITPFLLKNEPTSVLCAAWLIPRGGGARVKASLNRAIWWHIHDPKPGELAMNRMKLREIEVEVRTHEPCNTRG